MNQGDMLRTGAAEKPLAVKKHPLDPLTSTEIIQVSTLLKLQGVGKDQGLHFKAISIIEPPKSELRAFLSAERNDLNLTPPARRASALFYHRGTSDLSLAELNLDLNCVENIRKLESRIHAQADNDETILLREACLKHPKVLEAIKRFKLPEDLTVACDNWPYGRDHGNEFPRLVQVRSLLEDIYSATGYLQ